jgi:hypothetical protein
MAPPAEVVALDEAGAEEALLDDVELEVWGFLVVFTVPPATATHM